MLLALPGLCLAQKGRFAVQFNVKSLDCNTGKVVLRVQVKANSADSTFLMGDANYRFDYDSQIIRNPQIVSQETFSNQAPASDNRYNPQNLNGSTVGPTLGTVSLNTVYGGSGTGAKLVGTDWITVSCIQFDIVSTQLVQSNCFGLRWHTDTMFPNFGTGVYLSSDRGYLSVSAPRLIKNKLSEYNVGALRSVQARQGYVAAGFVVGLGASVKLKPSLLVKYAEGAPLGFDGNVNVWFGDRVSVGASVRRNQFSSWSQYTTDAIVGLVELQLTNQIRFGYAYDRTMNQLQSVAPSSHEVMLRYEFGFGKNRILTPRYF